MRDQTLDVGLIEARFLTNDPVNLAVPPSNDQLRVLNGQADPAKNGIYGGEDTDDEENPRRWVRYKWTGPLTVIVGTRLPDGSPLDGLYEMTDGSGIVWDTTAISATRK